MGRPPSSKIGEGKRHEMAKSRLQTAPLVLSLISADGAASGATVQSIAAMRLWLMHQSYNKSGV